MIKIIFYQSFKSKEIKHRRWNKGFVENSLPAPDEKIFRRLVNLNVGK